MVRGVSRGRLRCCSHCVLYGLLLQRHHRLGHLLLLRFVYHATAVDDVQQLSPHSLQDQRQTQNQGRFHLGVQTEIKDMAKVKFDATFRSNEDQPKDDVQQLLSKRRRRNLGQSRAQVQDQEKAQRRQKDDVQQLPSVEVWIKVDVKDVSWSA